MRRVELFEIMRKDHEFGLSIRAIADKRGVHRRAVRQALASPVPPARKAPQRHCPVMTAEVKAFIDGILVADKDAPKKQRHSARRIWQRCSDELGSAAEVTIRRYVRGRRRELGVGIHAFVPQHHAIGAQAEVDFYEAFIDFSFGRRKAKIITVRSEFSAASLHIAYPSQTQAALLEGIALGLEFLGGVFARMRFDNLTQAVARVIRGERRIEQDRFIAFRSHYLFESSFTSPGIEGAHEKGGVENEVGRFRRRWLTPVPSVSSWAEFNDYLKACCIRVEHRSPASAHRDLLQGTAVRRGSRGIGHPRRNGQKPGVLRTPLFAPGAWKRWDGAMNNNACHQYRPLIGSYVLGHLDDAERSRLEAHLEGCGDCRTEVDELAPVAGTLDRARPFQDPRLPPDHLVDRVVHVIRRAAEIEGRRRKLLVLAGAAALLVLVGAGVALTRDGSAPFLRLAAPTGISASASIEAKAWAPRLTCVSRVSPPERRSMSG